MKYLILIFLILPGNLFSQTYIILNLPFDEGILKQNKVAAIHVHENIDSFMIQTNSYYFDKQGRALEHYYYDPANEGSGPFDVERVRRSEDTAGFFHYTRGLYSEDGSRINLFADHQYFYSPTGKLKKMIYHDFMDYQTLRMTIYDTLHPEFENRSEWRLMENDTLYEVKDVFDGSVRLHSLRTKKNGKWVNTEIGTTTYKDGKAEKYVLFKEGKKVQEKKMKDEPEKKEIDSESENALPTAEPYIKTVYSKKRDLIFESEEKHKNANFRIVLHYESGKDSNLSFYEVYDSKLGLLLLKSDPAGEYKTEFFYNFF